VSRVGILFAAARYWLLHNDRLTMIATKRKIVGRRLCMLTQAKRNLITGKERKKP